MSRHAMPPSPCVAVAETHGDFVPEHCLHLARIREAWCCTNLDEHQALQIIRSPKSNASKQRRQLFHIQNARKCQ